MDTFIFGAPESVIITYINTTSTNFIYEQLIVFHEFRLKITTKVSTNVILNRLH